MRTKGSYPSLDGQRAQQVFKDLVGVAERHWPGELLPSKAHGGSRERVMV